VRIGQGRGKLGFPIEALDISEVFTELGIKDLHSDKTPFVDIFGQIYPGHPAATHFT
jgi:hypothetical protein